MSWTFKQSAVGSASGNTGTTVSAAFSSPVAAGDILIVHVQTMQPGSTQSVKSLTDSAGNTYTNLGGIEVEYGTSGDYMYVDTWTAIAETVATPTVTATISAAAYINISLAEFSFTGGRPSGDGYTTASTTGTTVGSGAFSITSTDLVVALGSQLNTSNPTWTDGNGFSTLANVPWSSTAVSLQVEYQENVTSSPVSAPLTSSQAVAGAYFAHAFKLVKPTYTVTGPNVGVSGSISGQFTVTPGAFVGSDTITLSDGGAGGTFSPTSLVFFNTSAPMVFNYTNATTSLPTITLTSSVGGTITGSPWTYTALVSGVGSFRSTSDIVATTNSTPLYVQNASSSGSCFIKFNSITPAWNATAKADLFYGNMFGQTYQTPFSLSAPQADNASRFQVEIGGGADNLQPFITPIVGLVYHVAGSWSPTQQTVYVNGKPVASASFQNVTSGASAPTPFYLGWLPIDGSVDYEISQLALWNDYALTQADVTNLLYQVETPATISTPATSWWPFAGTSGNMVEPGDAGLADVRSGLNFTGINAASSFNVGSATTNSNNALVYAGSLAYTPPITCVPYVSKSGGLLFFHVVTASTPQEPQYITSVSANPTVYVNGTQVAVAGPFWTMQTNQLPFVVYRLPSTVLPTDVVTYTAPLGWLSSSLGSVGQSPPPGVSGQVAVANYTGQFETPVGTAAPFGVPASQQKMTLGFNMSAPPATDDSPWYGNQNWLKRIQSPWSGVLSVDSLGHPLTLNAKASGVVVQGTPDYIDAMSYPCITGTWTFVANESAPSTPMTVTMSAPSNQLNITGGIVSQGTLNANGVAVGKTWQFTTSYPSSPANWAQSLQINIAAYNNANPGNWTLSDECLYGPGGDGAPVATFSQPTALAMDQSALNSLTTPNGYTAHCLRWMDSTATYAGQTNVVDASDLLNPDLFSWNVYPGQAGYTGVSVTIQTIRPYSLTAISGVTPGSPLVYSNQFGTTAPSGSPAPYQIAPANLDFMQAGSGTNTQWYMGEAVTTAPHMLKTGQLLTTGNMPATPITLTNGSSATTTFELQSNMGLLVVVTGTDTFAFLGFAGNAITLGSAQSMPAGINNVANSQASVALSVPASITLPYGSTIPYDAALAATASLPNAGVWINIPYAATDACVEAIAQLYLQYVPKGRQVYVELGNEVWNYKDATQYMNMMGGLGVLDVGYPNAYVQRTSQVHYDFLNVLNQAGRGNELVRVMGAQWTGQAQATALTQEAAYRAANFPTQPPIQIDVLCVAPYLNIPDETWPDPSVAATVNVTGGGSTGGSLAAGTYYVSYTWIDSLTGLETSPGGSQSPWPNPTAVPTGTASGTTGSLPPGAYLFGYTYTASSGGETAAITSGYTVVSVQAGNVLTITFNDTMPTWATGRNLYLTPSQGPTGSETLYATGITASTYAASSASWTNGTTTQAAAKLMPTYNTTSIGTAFTVASGNIPTVTIALQPSSLVSIPYAASANIYLSQPGSVPGPMVLYMTGVTSTTVNLTAANTGTISPPPHSRIPSYRLAIASTYASYPTSIAHTYAGPLWTRPMVFDMMRHYIHYSSQWLNPLGATIQWLQDNYVPVNNQPAGFVPSVVAYEASLQGLCSGAVGADAGQPINFAAMVTHDLFYDPNMYDLETEYYRMCQAAGMTHITAFNYVDTLLAEGTTTWGTSVYQGQPWGKGDGSNGGITNLFVDGTGVSQHQHNASVKMQAWRDWASNANVPVSLSPTKHTSKWFPRLASRIGRGY